MTPIAIASCIFIALGVIAIVALAVAALRSKPGFRRRGCNNFAGIDRRCKIDHDFDSTPESILEMARMDVTIKTQQLKGNK